jgi:O-antigen/teichoic acid export membrane protein
LYTNRPGLRFLSFAKKIGLTPALLWIFANRVFQIIKGPFSALIQLACLSPHDQGTWFTFSSLGALTVCAELGFTQIISQFVSHEFAHLSSKDGKIYGEPHLLNKFLLLIKYAIKFYLIIIPLAIILLSITGVKFFSREYISVIFAWCIYSFSGGIALLVSLFQSIYLGLDKVSDIQKNILINSGLSTAIMWILLFSGMGVFSLAISGVLGNIIIAILLYKLCPAFWLQVIFTKTKKDYKWSSEVLPLQWKYAISFISGYFMFQLYVPAVYKVDGNILSGQLGISLVLIGLLRGISDAFVNSQYPRLNILVAQKKELEMYKMYIRLFLCALVINILGGIVVILFIKIISNTPIGQRFLNIELITLLIMFNVPINIIGVLGNYTLIHKDASLYPLSVFAGIAGIISMMLVYPRYNLYTAFIFLVLSYWALILPANVAAFIIKRKKYLQRIW